MTKSSLRVLWSRLGRRYQQLVLLLVVVTAACVLSQAWWISRVTSALLPPYPQGQDLRHYRRDRNLKRYLDNIQLLIEPSSSHHPCEGTEEVPLLVLVSSAPSNLDSRQAIRQTWARHVPTFFVMGLDGPDVDEKLVDIYIEAKQYGDMLVYDFADHYQNLTLKTALMLEWSSHRCPQAQALFKTDDDVFVNPWMLGKVVKEHVNSQLIGYKINNSLVHRDEYTKWYLPRWLYPDEVIPEYLSGTGYIINGEYIERILKAAYKVPLINLEDVYLTHIVAKRTLHLTLSHDRRLSPYKPWIRSACSYWWLATAHSLSPDEVISAWSSILPLIKQFKNGRDVCNLFRFLSSYMFLY
ncbi:beta-1,3-galactosyltransferase 1-like [Ostrinia nubilalis]|uniref:beta-1,3-galactosyltransferase 1-like n=1 Tax=Ostrinia nubilalis TaxID=29057 RepID=UPI00308222BA